MADLKLPNLNMVQVVGRLTRDPELAYTSSGVPFAKFSMAVSKKYQVNGEWREDTIFMDCIAWQKLGEYVGQAHSQFYKGAPILVQGELAQDKWVDRATGQERTKIVIKCNSVQGMVWPEGSGGGGGNASNTQRTAAPRTQQQTARPAAETTNSAGADPWERERNQPQPSGADMVEDDLPF